MNFKYGSGTGPHKTVPENTCITGLFFINEPYLTHTILKKEKDLSRQIKSEVKRLKADFLANQITDYLENGNWKPLKRSRGQSSHINMACQ